MVEIDTYNPSTQLTETLRLCNIPDAADAVHNGNQYLAVLGDTLPIVDDLFGIEAGGEAGTTAATIVINNRSGELDSWLDNQFADQEIRILSAPPKSDYSAYVREFTGLAQNPSATLNQISVTASSILERARVPLCKDTYTGAGGAEGPATLRNVRKPVALGTVLNVEPVAVDVANLIYQWHGSGPVQGVTAVYSSGNPLPSTVGNVANYAALVALEVPPGRYATCNAEGLIKVGAAITKLTLDGQGCNDGGFVSTHAAIIERMLTKYAELNAAQIDSASLTALDTAVPGLAQLWAQSEVTVLDFCVDMMASLHGYVKAGASGDVQVGLIRFGASVLNFSANELTRDNQFSRLPVQQPFHKRELGYSRVWSIHSAQEIVEIDPGAELFSWTGSRIVPVNTDAAGGAKFYFNSAVAGAARLFVNVTDAEGFIFVNLNGTDLGPLSGNDQEIKDFDLPTDALIVGENEISIYSTSSSDGATFNSIEVFRGYLNQALDQIAVSGIVGNLTNGSHTVQTASDGSGGDFTGAGGVFKVFSGTTDVTADATFSVVSSDAALSISIDNTGGASKGTYTITALTADQATATLRAVYNGVTIDQIYSISKSKAGVNGLGVNASLLRLIASGLTFTYDGNGNADPSSQTITLTADGQNLDDQIVFSTSPSVTLTGTGNTRSLSIANFGINAAVEVTVTSGAFSDTVRIVRLQDGPKGDKGDEGDPGADGLLPFGFKPNFNSFSGVNPGELFIHGLQDGQPADINGTFVYNGTEYTIPRAAGGNGVLTNIANTLGWICFDISGANFTVAPSAPYSTQTAFVYQRDGVWYYDTNPGETQFTPNANHVAIGTCLTGSADSIEAAGPIVPVGLLAAPNAKAYVSRGASFPSNPFIGQWFERTDLKATYQFNGSTWDRLGGDYATIDNTDQLWIDNGGFSRLDENGDPLSWDLSFLNADLWTATIIPESSAQVGGNVLRLTNPVTQFGVPFSPSALKQDIPGNVGQLVLAEIRARAVQGAFNIGINLGGQVVSPRPINTGLLPSDGWITGRFKYRITETTISPQIYVSVNPSSGLAIGELDYIQLTPIFDAVSSIVDVSQALTMNSTEFIDGEAVIIASAGIYTFDEDAGGTSNTTTRIALADGGDARLIRQLAF
ncbi:MAG: hypothetical protein AAGA36_00190 [Pseudomonadota bacterium]